nr:hypothetical protein BAR15_180071 [Bartonella sp. AR 15-3]
MDKAKRLHSASLKNHKENLLFFMLLLKRLIIASDNYNLLQLHPHNRKALAVFV